MRIGEIAEKTGLSISNIRFYEKKGLIGPERESDNQYRTYTEEDLERLNLIILYRKMDLPVETIGQILEGKLSARDALEQQLLDLTKRQQMLQGSIDLCSKFIEDDDCEHPDVDFYLNYVREEESAGKTFFSIDELDKFVEDFSAYTNFDRFVGGKALGWWLFRWPWLYRLVVLLWLLVFIMIPVVGLVEAIMEEGMHQVTELVFWIAWMIIVGGGFAAFLVRRKRPGGKKTRVKKAKR